MHSTNCPATATALYLTIAATDARSSTDADGATNRDRIDAASHALLRSHHVGAARHSVGASVSESAA